MHDVAELESRGGYDWPQPGGPPNPYALLPGRVLAPLAASLTALDLSGCRVSDFACCLYVEDIWLGA